MPTFPIPIHHKIYELRGRQIMLDEDLAVYENLWSQIVTSSVKRHGGRRYYPNVFIVMSFLRHHEDR